MPFLAILSKPSPVEHIGWALIQLKNGTKETRIVE